MKRIFAAFLAVLLFATSVSAMSLQERDFRFKYALKFYGAGYVDLPDNLLPHEGDEDRTIVLFMRIPEQRRGSYEYHNDILRGPGTGWGISTNTHYNTHPEFVIWCNPYAPDRKPYGWAFGMQTEIDKVIMLVVSWDYDNSTEKTTVSAYINNILKMNRTFSGKFDEHWSLKDLALGTGPGGGLYGTIYALYIYNRPLSKAEREQIFNTPSAPPKAGLLAWYMPDSVDIDTLKWVDLSGNKNDAKIKGVKTVDLFDEYKRANTAEEKQIIARLLPPSASAEGLLEKLRSFFTRLLGHLIFGPLFMTRTEVEIR